MSLIPPCSSSPYYSAGLSVLSPRIPSAESLSSTLSSALQQREFFSAPAPRSASAVAQPPQIAPFHSSSSERYMDGIAKSLEAGRRRARELEVTRARMDGLMDRLNHSPRIVPTAVKEYDTKLRTTDSSSSTRGLDIDPSFAQRVQEAKDKIMSLRQQLQQRTALAPTQSQSMIMTPKAAIESPTSSSLRRSVSDNIRMPPPTPLVAPAAPRSIVSDLGSDHEFDDTDDEIGVSNELTETQKVLYMRTMRAASGQENDDIWLEADAPPTSTATPHSAEYKGTSLESIQHMPHDSEATARPSDDVQEETPTRASNQADGSSDDEAEIDIDRYAPVTESQRRLILRTLQAARSPAALIHAKVFEEQLRSTRGVRGDGSKTAPLTPEDEGDPEYKRLRSRALKILSGNITPENPSSKRVEFTSGSKKIHVPTHLMDKYARMCLDAQTPSGLEEEDKPEQEPATTTEKPVAAEVSIVADKPRATTSTVGAVFSGAQENRGAASMPAPPKKVDDGLDALRLALAVGSSKTRSGTGVQRMESQLAAMLENKFKELVSSLDDDDDL